MKPIKYRWRLWKIYTNKVDKAVHAVVAIIFSAAMIASLVNFSWLNLFAAAGYVIIGYSLIMKDVWGNAYQQTESLRFVGWHLNKALNEWTFVKATKVGNEYALDPDRPTVDPDAIDDDIYTDEIVIRRGMSVDGDPLIAWSIPEDLETETVLGMLEHTKLQYSYDILADPHE